MSNITQTDSQFQEILSGLFYDVFRHAGITLTSIQAQEKIRETSRRLALSLEYRGEIKAVEVIQRLQVAVKTAFNAMERDLIRDRKQVEEVRATLEGFSENLLMQGVKHSDLITEFRELNNNYKKLTAKVDKLLAKSKQS